MTDSQHITITPAANGFIIRAPKLPARSAYFGEPIWVSKTLRGAGAIARRVSAATKLPLAPSCASLLLQENLHG